MHQFPIGVMMEAFRTDTRQAIEQAARLGVKGMQMDAAKGEHAPEHMTKEARRELLDRMHSNGLVFSALCGDLGKGFGNPELNPALIEQSKRILDLAKELGTDIVTTHIGVVPADKTHPRYQIMQDACGELSRYADSLGAHFAIETGPEVSIVLKDFLDSLDSKGVAVNLDPANLAMVTGDDPVQAVYNLKDYIVHTHAKDGIKLRENNPELVYGIIKGEAPQERGFQEVSLGKGEVPFAEYLAALEDIDYGGFLTIERKVGDNPAGEIALAIDFLQNHMKIRDKE